MSRERDLSFLKGALTRRRFVAASATAAAAGVVLPAVAHAAVRNAARTAIWGPAPLVLTPRSGGWGDPDQAALAAHAVEAAMSAGATYADVRMTTYRKEEWQGLVDPPIQAELCGVGVRTIADGHWGFMSSTVWTPDEMVRLAKGAVAQARAHASVSKRREITLSPIPVARGEWTMPIKYDPFDVPMSERTDFFRSVQDLAGRMLDVKRINAGYVIERMHKVFASSDGSAWKQTTYATGGNFGVEVLGSSALRVAEGGARIDGLALAGRGWEHLSESGLTERIPDLFDRAREARYRTTTDVGRYDIVLSSQVMAAVAAPTLARATELDRALGFEASATGTSYLNDPFENIGTFKVGNPRLNVAVDRTVEGTLGAVKWDDEGTVPERFPLVKDGMLVDYQTTREQAPWLASYYAKTGTPVRSHGCASSESALYISMQHPCNVHVMPGMENYSYQDLIASTEKGIALDYVAPENVRTDQQGLNGVIYATAMREIVKGKLGRYLDGSAVVFRAPEFWRTLVALGGANTMAWHPVRFKKGQPEQTVAGSVGAVPGKFTNAAVVDIRRR